MSKITEIHHHWIDKVAFLNAIVGAIALYPQLYNLMTSNVRTENLSILSFSLIFLNSIVWLLYGIHRKISPLVISSVLNVVASGLILYLILDVKLV